MGDETKPGSNSGAVRSVAGTLACATKTVCRTSYEYGWAAAAWTCRLVGAQTSEVVKGVYDEKAIKALRGIGLPVADAALTEFSGLLPGGRPVYNIIKTGARSISNTYVGKNVVVKDKTKTDEKTTEAMETKMKMMEAEMKELKEKVLLSEIMRPGSGSLMKQHHNPVDVITLLKSNGFQGEKDLLNAIFIPKIIDDK